MNVIPGWFALSLLIATGVMLPAMMRRWHSMRGGRKGGPPHSVIETFSTVITHLWLPAAALAVPLVYVVRLLAF